MVSQENLSTFKKCNKGSFELTKLWIEKSEEIELSATAVSVMTALLWHYNPEKKFMYPHQDTIGKRIKRSVATVKRAITELKQKGYLVTTRSRNGNLYALTKKFFDLFEPSENQSCTISTAKNELCMIEQVKEQKKEQQKKVVVAFSSNSNKIPELKKAETVAPLVIPAIIKNNPKIKNPFAYWRSLDDTAKADYYRKEQEAAELKARQEAKEKEQQQRSYENYLKQQALKNAKPFSETCTKEQAISYIKFTYSKSEFMKTLAKKSRTVKELLNRFNLELSQVL
ncbi:helix-turn-helix domain-containing protein [Methanobrevibacter sp.]|uniref:helix-turn-helix domain-containing protein n=1 Tax=Methanobrevibacter sp. TaxID=66852 RepID=UPI003868DD89